MISLRASSILVLAPLLGLAACGGGTKKVDPVADLALAKKAALTSADMPGYTSTPYTSSDDLPASAKKDFATCMKTATTVFDDTPGEQKVNSPNFDKGNAEVQNTVEILPKKSDANTDWTVISKQEAAGCLQQLFESAIKAGAPSASSVVFSEAKVTRFDIGVGSRSVGYTISFTAADAGQTVTFNADAIFVQRNRAELSFFSSDTQAAPDRSFETGLVQKVYDRIGSGAA